MSSRKSVFPLVILMGLAATCEENGTVSEETIAAASKAVEEELKDTGRIDQAISGYPSIEYGSKDTTAELRELMADLLEHVHLATIRDSLDPKTMTGVFADAELFGPSKAPRRSAWFRPTSPRRQTDASCPVTTDNSKDATVEIRIQGGCSTADGVTVEGSILVAGTSDTAKGDAALGVQFDGWKMTVKREDLPFSLGVNGKGTLVAKGVLVDTPTFSLKRDFVATMDLAFGAETAKCPLESHVVLSGTSTQIDFDVKDDQSCTGPNLENLKVSKIKGTAAQSAEGFATVNATGEVVHYLSASGGSKGRVAIQLKEVVYDPAKCGPIFPTRSGELIVGSASPMTFQVTSCGGYKTSTLK